MIFHPRLMAVAATLAVLTVQPSHAHDFIVYPDATSVAEGEALPLSATVTEVYIRLDRLPPEDTSVELLSPEGAVTVPMAAEGETGAMTGTATAPTGDVFLLHGVSRRSRPVSRDPAEADGPILQMEWFSKAVINASAGADGYAQTVGDRIEIIPLVNPADLKPGNTMSVKVLLDGKPVATRVQATYAGFSDKEHGVIARTASNEDGLAWFTVTEPGLWFVKAKVVLDEKGEGYDRYEGAANLLFGVNEATR